MDEALLAVVDSALNLDEILEVIFSFLSAYKLGIICRVSKKWRRIAGGILIRRPKRVVCQYFDCDAYADPMMSFARERLAVPPQYGLVFATQALRRSFNRPSCRPLGLLVPDSCEVYSAVGYGCIGTTALGEATENEDGVGVAGLFIPRGLGDVRLTPVFLEHDVARLCEQQHPVRAFIIMHRMVEKCSSLVDQLVSACPDIVVAGGYIKQHADLSHIERYLGRTPSSNLTSNYPLVGFIISGYSVKVASVVLESDVFEQNDVRSLFVKLRETGILTAQGSKATAFALVFSCNGRGSYHYNGERNFEAREFMRVFPGVPLLGFFGYGEIGHMHLPSSGSSESTDPPARKRSKASPAVNYLERITRGYSSVYLLVSIAAH